MNYERLEKRKLDPNFLYENVRICGECYEMFRFALTLMKGKKSLRSQRGSMQASEDAKAGTIRNIPLPNLPKSQASAL
jgi:hypothetical protein